MNSTLDMIWRIDDIAPADRLLHQTKSSVQPLLKTLFFRQIIHITADWLAQLLLLQKTYYGNFFSMFGSKIKHYNKLHHKRKMLYWRDRQQSQWDIEGEDGPKQKEPGMGDGWILYWHHVLTIDGQWWHVLYWAWIWPKELVFWMS